MRTAYRLQCDLHAAIYSISTTLLAVVATTPSYSELHMFCALVVMGLMFLYFAVLLYASDQWFWLTIHLTTPSMAMMATGLESYGIWQKAIIVYILLGTVIHQGVLARWLPRRIRMSRRKSRIVVQERQVVCGRLKVWSRPL